LPAIGHFYLALTGLPGCVGCRGVNNNVGFGGLAEFVLHPHHRPGLIAVPPTRSAACVWGFQSNGLRYLHVGRLIFCLGV